eukprot:CAMPEP_0180670944 /NCGR_PEP_ID=MMETSP1037_2-20121125/64312_1 /TAXON_ID=632150 /ORGANISM="Azadinium spinosum, Strain 3D9" /LENGTH=54 /DNA_ID=CAMNT_0022699941 /DNA_START=363 /DNA_END=523 /DNA_ORIENTATION=-
MAAPLMQVPPALLRLEAAASSMPASNAVMVLRAPPPVPPVASTLSKGRSDIISG